MRLIPFVALLGAVALAEDGKLSPELQGLAAPEAAFRNNDGELIDVIVQYHQSPKAARDPMGKVRRHFQALPAQALSVPASKLRDLAADPNVAYITPDREVSATSSTMISLDDLRPMIGLPEIYTRAGAGVGVAILDSGMVSGDKFFNAADACTNSRIVYSESFVSGDSRTADVYGHGTHVAGIVGGNGKCISPPESLVTGTGATGFSGIAPGVRFINLRVLDNRGRGTDSAVIAAIDRAIQLRATYNIRVMNLSLGRFIRESFTLDPLCQAVERAWKAGIVVVVSAGNNGRDNSKNTQGYSTVSSPGNDPFVITVGSARYGSTFSPARNTATVASYSSKGPTLRDRIAKPDLLAPGNLVFSRVKPDAYLARSYSTNAYQITLNSVLIDSIFVLSGTSMAAPVVSGTAALMIRADSTLTPDQVKARLMKTAWKGFAPTAQIIDRQTNAAFNVQHDLLTVGAGLLDVPAALASSEKIDASARALSPKLAIVNGKVTLRKSSVAGVNVLWGDNVLWGENVVWGSNNVLQNNVLWGDNVVWGSSNLAGYNVVWGDNVLWGDGTPYSEALAVAGDR